jgi:hypothetical protein
MSRPGRRPPGRPWSLSTSVEAERESRRGGSYHIVIRFGYIYISFRINNCLQYTKSKSRMHVCNTTSGSKGFGEKSVDMKGI